ncbi:MAG: hypothetical protein M0Z95_19040 [Actinomycetota bacterium]|nr:hypothetical protein [Actinomycetota bacterium]
MTTTTKREAEITIGDTMPTIMIVRKFDAPATAVFRAHAAPELFVRWVLAVTLSAHGPAAIGDHRSATLREDAQWSE